jgi:SAM-dependent methyltransferase
LDKINKLKILYAQSSKHSNYQILSSRLSAIIGDNLEVKSRHEVERLNFILENLNIKEKNVADIGGNTGFFSFELIERGVKHVDYFEGNKIHSNFVKLAASLLGLTDRIKVTNKYINFENELEEKKYDITLLLNVLHHLGDDYGNRSITIEEVKQHILKQLNSLAVKTSFLVFQLGFNWKGDITLGLFANGTKREMIQFISEGTKDYWEILNIGIPDLLNGTVIYYQGRKYNIDRNDSVGEFLNRPLFIIKSKR